MSTPSRFPGPGLRCDSCGAGSVLSGRVREPKPRGVAPGDLCVYACEGCGEFWIEAAGERLSTDRLIELGLL